LTSFTHTKKQTYKKRIGFHKKESGAGVSSIGEEPGSLRPDEDKAEGLHEPGIVKYRDFHKTAGSTSGFGWVC